MNLEFYDVTILGGGPAGLAVALALRQHHPALRVVVLERGNYDTPRIGETLPPNARPLLQQLGVWPAFAQANHLHLPAYGTRAAWGSPTPHANDFFFSQYGSGWHLDRRAFNALLAELTAAQGVAVHTHLQTRAWSVEPDGQWRLVVHSPKQGGWILQTRFVVDATGRLARWARQQGASRLLYDHLVAVSVLLQVDPTQLDTYALVETYEHGWWYSALLPAGQLMVMCMSDADLVRQLHLNTPAQWLAQACLAPYTFQRLHQATPLAAPKVYAAYTHCLQPAAGTNWVAVGDAAAAFDPLASQGIYKALHSGLLAAYAILDWFKGNPAGLTRYATLSTHGFEHYLKVWHDYYGRERRWPRATFWARRQKASLV